MFILKFLELKHWIINEFCKLEIGNCRKTEILSLIQYELCYKLYFFEITN